MKGRFLGGDDVVAALRKIYDNRSELEAEAEALKARPEG